MSSGPWRHNRVALNLAFTGDSIVDFPKLDIQNRNEAKTFLTAYGYDAEDPIIREEIWRIYFEALHFIRNVLLDPHEVFPTAFYERNNQNDAIRLLMDASSPIRSERATWSCTILRVMHSISHLDNDLRLENFNYAREKIFSKFDPYVREVGPRRWVFGRADEEGIPLLRYQKKVKKERNSMILKLISKAQNDVELIYDSLGFRFVVEKSIDAIRLLEKFYEVGAVSYANIQPKRSFNSLIDTDLLNEAMTKIEEDLSKGLINMAEAEQRYKNLEIAPPAKPDGGPKNQFSSPFYRALQFTTRHLIQVQDATLPIFDRIRDQLGKNLAGRRFLKSFPIVLREKKTFYYPFEIQITDKESYVENLRGRSSHRSYKEKQRQMARKRVLRGIYGIMDT